MQNTMSELPWYVSSSGFYGAPSHQRPPVAKPVGKHCRKTPSSSLDLISYMRCIDYFVRENNLFTRVNSTAVKSPVNRARLMLQGIRDHHLLLSTGPPVSMAALIRLRVAWSIKWLMRIAHLNVTLLRDSSLWQ